MMASNVVEKPLTDVHLAKVSYDRRQLTPGIVHIGLGNFHRAHQAWYLHRLFEQGLNTDWAIIGAGVRPYDMQMREKIKANDCLTTLIEVEAEGASVETVGSMIDYLAVTPDNAALIQQMADPRIRIVSLTVTEGGYYVDQATQQFDQNHPDIQHDVNYPNQPKTAFGAMVAALKLRKAQGAEGAGPFTGLSCDNVRGNGDILRQTVVSLARLSDPDLADWIDQECSFPNSMVDCIVPVTGEKEIALAQSFNINDVVPVTHEHFRQWVIQDDFCAGRPDLQKVGVTFTNNVHDYENMKIRLLNGGHQLIAQLADLLGIETIAASMQHEQICAFFHKVEREEIAPHVKPVPEFTSDEYVELIGKRFSNPAIVDTTRRVAFDGSSRHPGFVLPSVFDGLKAGTPIEGLALTSAIWARYCLGLREDGSQILDNDPQWTLLNQQAQKAKQDPLAWLRMSNIYGDLAQQALFVQSFEKWLQQIHAQGVEAALDSYLAS